jgi:hypothetical protein
MSRDIYVPSLSTIEGILAGVSDFQCPPAVGDWTSKIVVRPDCDIDKYTAFAPGPGLAHHPTLEALLSARPCCQRRHAVKIESQVSCRRRIDTEVVIQCFIIYSWLRSSNSSRKIFHRALRRSKTWESTDGGCCNRQLGSPRQSSSQPQPLV